MQIPPNNSGIFIGGDNSGTAVIAQDITNSFNKATGEVKSEPLKATLEELHTQIQELLKNTTDPDKQKEIADNAKMVAEQSASEKPNKGWLEVSAKGLIEAATAVKDLAAPVLATVTTLLGFFGMVL